MAVRKDRFFMFDGLAGSEGLYQFTTGVKRFYNAEGTWRDAEDGHLMGNAIAQGSVDSTISFRLHVPPNSDDTLFTMAESQGMITPFFQFCASALSPDGYLHHKYNPDGTVGSSRHPYLIGGHMQLHIMQHTSAA